MHGLCSILLRSLESQTIGVIYIGGFFVNLTLDIKRALSASV